MAAPRGNGDSQYGQRRSRTRNADADSGDGDDMQPVFRATSEPWDRADYYAGAPATAAPAGKAATRQRLPAPNATRYDRLAEYMLKAMPSDSLPARTRGRRAKHAQDRPPPARQPKTLDIAKLELLALPSVIKMTRGIRLVCVADMAYLSAEQKKALFDYAVAEYAADQFVHSKEAADEAGRPRTYYTIAYRRDSLAECVATTLRIAARNAAYDMAVVAHQLYYNAHDHGAMPHALTLSVPRGTSVEAVRNIVSVEFHEAGTDTAEWELHRGGKRYAHCYDPTSQDFVMQYPLVYVYDKPLLPDSRMYKHNYLGGGVSAKVWANPTDGTRVLKVYRRTIEENDNDDDDDDDAKTQDQDEQDAEDSTMDAIREALSLVAAHAARARGASCTTAELIAVAAALDPAIQGPVLALVESRVNGKTFQDAVFDARGLPDAPRQAAAWREFYCEHARAMCIAASRALYDLEQAGVASMDIHRGNVLFQLVETGASVKYDMVVVDLGLGAVFGRRARESLPFADGYNYFDLVRDHPKLSIEEQRMILLQKYHQAPPEGFEGDTGLVPGARSDVWGLASLILNIISNGTLVRLWETGLDGGFAFATVDNDVPSRDMQAFLRACFHADQADRPSLQEAVEFLSSLSASKYKLVSMRAPLVVPVRKTAPKDSRGAGASRRPMDAASAMAYVAGADMLDAEETYEMQGKRKLADGDAALPRAKRSKQSGARIGAAIRACLLCARLPGVLQHVAA